MKFLFSFLFSNVSGKSSNQHKWGCVMRRMLERLCMHVLVGCMVLPSIHRYRIGYYEGFWREGRIEPTLDCFRLGLWIDNRLRSCILPNVEMKLCGAKGFLRCVPSYVNVFVMHAFHVHHAFACISLWFLHIYTDFLWRWILPETMKEQSFIPSASIMLERVMTWRRTRHLFNWANIFSLCIWFGTLPWVISPFPVAVEDIENMESVFLYLSTGGTIGCSWSRWKETIFGT